MSRKKGSLAMSFHLKMNVRELLDKNDRDLWKCLRGAKDDKGYVYQNIHEIRHALYSELAQGHEYIPLGECDNFDFKKGCRGHVEK